MATLRAHLPLTPPEAGDVLVTASIGPADEAIAVWAAPADRQAILTPAVRPGSCAQRPVPARVVTATATSSTVTHLDAIDLPFCQAQPMPDGQFLMVAARGGAATIFDADGVPAQCGNVRDGIEHIMTTPSGAIWIGYFDEGVYGDDPVAHHGIVRFTPDLEPDWTFPFDTGFGPVDDCYALNVAGEAAWSCYYSGFPIVRIHDGAVTGWRNQVAGARALLAARDMVALIGGYREDHDRVVVGHLGPDRFEAATTVRLTLPDNRALPDSVILVGRGPSLHAFHDNIWYRTDLDDLTR